MIGDILIFVSGMLVGSLAGIFVVALAVAAGEDDRRNGRK